MLASLFRVFARLIMASPEFCWSQGPAAARRVAAAVTAIGLHWVEPPAAVHADSQGVTESMVVCAIRLDNDRGAARTVAVARAKMRALVNWTIMD